MTTSRAYLQVTDVITGLCISHKKMWFHHHFSSFFCGVCVTGTSCIFILASFLFDRSVAKKSEWRIWKKKSSFLIQYSNYFMPSAWHNKLHLEHFYVQLFMTVNCRIPSGINKIITEKKKKKKNREREHTRQQIHTRPNVPKRIVESGFISCEIPSNLYFWSRVKKSFNFQVKSRLNSLEPYF